MKVLSSSPMVITLLVAMAAATLLLPACDKPTCEKACQRLAKCRLAQRDGERILGERPMPPDPVCLDRCARQTEAFVTCEEKKRECGPLLECARALGY